MSPAQPSLLRRAGSMVDRFRHEVGKFGAVGLTAFAIDTAIYNVLVFGIPGAGSAGVMVEMPLRAKILATCIATVFSWLGNRYWTFRHRRRGRKTQEFVLFYVFNALGLLIALACLGFSRYVLDLHSQLADNLSGNGVGLVLGTLFRFWAYRTFVFAETGQGPTADRSGAQRAGVMDT